MLPEDAKCSDCNHKYVIYKKSIKDDFVSGKCPECGSENTYRMFGCTALYMNKDKNYKMDI